MFYYVVYLLGSAEEEASIVFSLSSAYTVRIEDLGQVLPRPYVTQAFICREKIMCSQSEPILPASSL